MGPLELFLLELEEIQMTELVQERRLQGGEQRKDVEGCRKVMCRQPEQHEPRVRGPMMQAIR